MIIELKKVPPTFNHVWKHRIIGKSKPFVGVYVSKEGKEFKEYMRAVICKIDPLNCLQGDLQVTINLTFPDRRKRDVDNYAKIILDSMNGLIYIDDSQIKKLIMTKTYEKGISETRIIIEKIE